MREYIFITITAVFFLASTLFAADLGDFKIIDNHGLVRSHTRSAGKHVVTVTLSVAPTDAPLLSNVDGLAADIEGEAIAPKYYRFKNVQPGSWKISGGQFEVERVEIQ